MRLATTQCSQCTSEAPDGTRAIDEVLHHLEEETHGAPLLLMGVRGLLFYQKGSILT